MVQSKGSLLVLPIELIHNVLLHLPPISVEHFSQTCKLARHYVYGEDDQGDAHLWMRLYLQHFDSNASLWSSHGGDENNSFGPSVMSLVQSRARAQRLFAEDAPKSAQLAQSYNSVLSALLSVIDTADSTSDPSSSRSAQWLSNAVVTDSMQSWADWIFPRNLMRSLCQHKLEARKKSSQMVTNGQKRQRPGNADATKSSNARKGKGRNLAEGRRRRSTRLLKTIYPEELHDLVDEGVDIDSFAEPNMHLAARLHCLHGVRTWKDSQAKLASQNGIESHNSVQPAEQRNTDADDEQGDPLYDFDEPPSAILTYRPRQLGPTFGFCASSEEEDKLRARMRELVYDAGYYSWSNGYGPLHPWRIREDIEGRTDEVLEEERHAYDYAIQHVAEWGSDADADDASILDENDDDDDDSAVPDDAVPIEIEGSSDEEHRPTFRLADRYGHLLQDPEDRGAPPPSWDSSDDDDTPQAETTAANHRTSEEDHGWDSVEGVQVGTLLDAVEMDEDDEDDDDFDATDEEDDDDMTPMSSEALTRTHVGSYARKEIQEYQKEVLAAAKGQTPEAMWSCATTSGSLRRKMIHWELLEAIMVVMYANLREGVWLEGWGVGIKLPKIFSADGTMVSDPMEERKFLNFPTGWASSMQNPLPPKPREVPTNGKQKENASQDTEKPYDWARCESFWGGTYSFLDYRNFVYFNARVAQRVQGEAAAMQTGATTGAQRVPTTSNGRAPAGASSSSITGPTLVSQEEAVGDCLQLRLQLLPKSLAPTNKELDEGQPDDPDYPTLHFRGTTVTYWGTEAPIARGGVYGHVRPIYAAESSSGAKRIIEGIHWSLTHVYDGEDRWQLEGVQPGPPGTKAPIFGIWTDAMHAGASPNGPFVYWMMDERPWTEIERLNQEAEQAAARRAGPPRGTVTY